jgi:predicted enzyme related to lactoylglutathione lyase
MSDTTQAMKPGTACWFEIPVSDLDRAKTYYETVLGITMKRDDNGPNPMVAFTSMDDPVVGGHLYPGEPAGQGQGNTIHLVAPAPLEDVMARVVPAGGKVVSPVIPIPAGRFVYTTDPDGNSVGLFNFGD